MESLAEMGRASGTPTAPQLSSKQWANLPGPSTGHDQSPQHPTTEGGQIQGWQVEASVLKFNCKFIRKAMDKWTLSYQLRKKWKKLLPLSARHTGLSWTLSCGRLQQKSARKCFLDAPSGTARPDCRGPRGGCWCLELGATGPWSSPLAESGSRPPSRSTTEQKRSQPG